MQHDESQILLRSESGHMPCYQGDTLSQYGSVASDMASRQTAHMMLQFRAHPAKITGQEAHLATCRTAWDTFPMLAAFPFLKGKDFLCLIHRVCSSKLQFPISRSWGSARLSRQCCLTYDSKAGEKRCSQSQ